jgi:glutamate/aspartate transport system permease protein
MLNLDYSFLTWGVIQSFVFKGLIFSFKLTLVAMIGGIILGTVLAMMRLSGKPWLATPAAVYVDTLRSIPLVMVILWFFLLIPKIAPVSAEASAFITFTLFEATYYSERSCGRASRACRGGR